MIGGKSEYVAEAYTSAKSFRQHHPSWQMRLITPNTITRGDTFNHITKVSYNPNVSWYLNLVEWYQLLPDLADHVYLFDSDTRICSPLDGPLRLLRKFDFLGCHAPGRRTCKTALDIDVSKVEFPEINVGFLAFNGNDSVRQLFRMWRDLYEAHQATYGNNDQGPLRDALWQWSGSFYILPTEYNFRYGFGGQVRGKVRVLHGRSKTPIDEVERIVNASGDIRAWRKGEF
jgi:hypothetical protein